MTFAAWLLRALPIAVAAGVFIGERLRPLRQRSGGGQRLLTNAILAAVATPVTARIEQPAVLRLARRTQARGTGLLDRLGLHPPLADLATVLLLDYSMFLWHVLLHRRPLWRLHEVHHLDVQLDASTALRFHVGEMLASIPFRAAYVRLLGLTPRGVDAWYRLFAACVLFHHANLRLPERFERRLAWLIVTPRMHGIHHSNRPSEQHSNWSSGLTVWDRVHGSLRFDVPQERIRMGTPDVPRPRDMAAGELLRLPLRSSRGPERSPGAAASNPGARLREPSGPPSSP